MLPDTGIPWDALIDLAVGTLGSAVAIAIAAQVALMLVRAIVVWLYSVGSDDGFEPDRVWDEDDIARDEYEWRMNHESYKPTGRHGPGF